MTDSSKRQNDFSLEDSIPAAPLESILCTEELRRRPSHPPDYEKENRALVALASAMVYLPREVLDCMAQHLGVNYDYAESVKGGAKVDHRGDGKGDQ